MRSLNVYRAIPRSVEAGDEYWSEARETIEIINDRAPIDTGLVNEHGVPIVRMPHPVGFCR